MGRGTAYSMFEVGLVLKMEKEHPMNPYHRALMRYLVRRVKRLEKKLKEKKNG